MKPITITWTSKRFYGEIKYTNERKALKFLRGLKRLQNTIKKHGLKNHLVITIR